MEAQKLDYLLCKVDTTSEGFVLDRLDKNVPCHTRLLVTLALDMIAFDLARLDLAFLKQNLRLRIAGLFLSMALHRPYAFDVAAAFPRPRALRREPCEARIYGFRSDSDLVRIFCAYLCCHPCGLFSDENAPQCCAKGVSSNALCLAALLEIPPS